MQALIMSGSFAAVGVGLYLINPPLAAVFGSALAGMKISNFLFKQDDEIVQRAIYYARRRFREIKPLIFPVGFFSAAVISRYSPVAGSVVAAILGVLRGLTYDLDTGSYRRGKFGFWVFD